MERNNAVTGHSLEIMEVTLRDGSYVIDFQFTAGDTALISAALEEVGFGLIEVGHGVGVGASKAGYGEAAESDETYMKVTAAALSSAKWGMFCIPGIGFPLIWFTFGFAGASTFRLTFILAFSYTSLWMIFNISTSVFFLA